MRFPNEGIPFTLFTIRIADGFTKIGFVDIQEQVFKSRLSVVFIILREKTFNIWLNTKMPEGN